MKPTKKIAILLPSLAGGGAERISVNLANEFLHRGFSVDLILMSATGPFIDLLDPKINIVDLQVSRMREVFSPLKCYLQNEKPEVMLANMWPLTVISIISSKLAFVKTRIFVAEHITWSKAQIEYASWLRVLIPVSMRIFFPFADGIVANSNGTAVNLANFAGLSLDAITTIYNPVVNKLVTNVKETATSNIDSWNKAEIRILTVGNLKEQKNHELLLQAFSMLLKHRNANLLILGEGHLRSKLERQVAELGIENRVSMPGFRADPYPYYNEASLFVLSSDWEGLPTVLIEALASGTPIVSTDCPSGPKEILGDGRFGRLVPVSDALALCEAMAAALVADHDRVALRNHAKRFSIDNATDQYESLFFHSGPK